MTTEKKRPGSIAGDVERTVSARTKSNPKIPIPVEVDPEMTPPPQSPPIVESMSLEERVEVLRIGATEHAAAIARVWEARNLNENVVTIGQDVAELSALMRDFLMPAVKTLLGRVDAIERANAANSARQDRFWQHEWPTALKTLEDLSRYTSRIEKDVDRIERSVTEHVKRSDERHESTNSTIGELKANEAKQETRLRAVEDFVLTFKAKVAIVSALVGGGGAGAALAIKAFLFGG